MFEMLKMLENSKIAAENFLLRQNSTRIKILLYISRVFELYE